MKHRIIKISFCVFFAMGSIAFVQNSHDLNKPIYLNTAYSFEERAVDLVSRMTLEEKQSLLGNTMAPIPRLGVNKYDVWGEALHGVMGRNNNSGMTATSFPNSNAIGCTWDPELIRREASVIAAEARGFNHDLIFTLTYWSPVIEPARDPRWGRTAETFGEDPFLVSQIGSGFIRGMMGNDERYLKTVPCGKHYLANNTEFNRHTGSSDMDNRDMREFYLRPYKVLIEEDDMPSIMTAYNAVNGVPVSASKFLVDTIARRTYGMKGYVTGDCGAITDLIVGHHYAKDGPEATAMGLIAGVDSDCGGEYQSHVITALERGLITEADIDRALINMFTIRMRLGEFDPARMVPYAGIKPGIINDPSHNELALEIATKTPVLLKNEVVSAIGEKALPLRPQNIQKIAVLGPHANKIELGDYSGPVEDHYVSTPLQGIKSYVKRNNLGIEVVHGDGGNIDRRNDFFTLSTFTTVSNSGEKHQYDATIFDESASGIIASERFGTKSLRGIKDGDWTAYYNIDVTRLDSIMFNMNVALSGGAIEVRVDSPTGNILASEMVESSSTGGFFGSRVTVAAKVNTLGITGPRNIYFIYREPQPESTDQATLDLAASSDVAIIFVGTDQTTGREESDRFSLALPGNQMNLIQAVAEVNPNTIVVMQTMGMVEVEEIKHNPNIPGIFYVGYNGQAQGAAIAKVLFGEINPGGKTTVTWYKSVDDLPDFNDYTLRGDDEKNGRTYMYFDKDVSYEFGFGLSYTTFEYSNFKISKSEMTPNDMITVSVDVKNSGNVDGDEVVQVYVTTPDSPVSLQRPIKRLKGFKRVTIPAGQIKTVSIDINCFDLWFWNEDDNKLAFDNGRYVFEIGASSRDIKGTVEAVMAGKFKAELKTVVATSDKIVLQPGDKSGTSFTACLTDDSFIDVRHTNVEYVSNNPSVITVNESGVISALKPGVATVFVHVTHNGVTVSDDFPIKVMPNLTPASITINGRTLKGFNADKKAYSYLMNRSSRVPRVNASAESKDVTVEIQQAKGIPGTAIISFVDYNTYEKNTYYINFDVASVSDEFNNGQPGSQWNWVRENPNNHSFTSAPGALTITAEEGDISEGSNNARNLLLQSANNDWTIETKLVASRTPSQPENAGIVAYQDDDNFVKLMFRAVIKTSRQTGVQPGTIDLLFEENGIAKSVASINLKEEVIGDNHLLLRLSKEGSRYSAYYSVDGKTFEKLGESDILLKDIHAGLLVCDGVITQSMTSTFWFDSSTTKPDSPFDVSFDYFRIQNRGLK
ncbi:glycoside hydrolase family 3 C-terminal domain-containing protein [Natronoflexus pectinivorans]|uniref:Beta-glucosidase-like glycosyl hydrolase n=1 Tax=Natronoflexus pectinivorans TaxID=682526 RepID=A0A4R2GNR9_9BACT|nr:glycoside hydrolase family 3 C-terminal domain-containing protein [Natronoflexus pectinivorans]TCO10677.1 beta-glucosidase-like glycosyl hydrolase [Natronoflexus pectinivorans]